VHRFLEREDGDEADLPFGPVGTWLSLSRAAEDPERWSATLRRVEITKLEVVDADADHAVADVEAARHYEHRDPAGKGATDVQIVRYVGPFTLQRVEGVWRVVDFWVDGKLASDAIRVDLRGSQEREGVVVRPVAAWVGLQLTVLVLVVENKRGHALDARLGAVARQRRLRRWRGAGLSRRRISSDASTLVALHVRGGFAGESSRLAVALLLEDPTGAVHLPFLLSVDLSEDSAADTAAPPTRLPIGATLEGRMPNATLFLGGSGVLLAAMVLAQKWQWLGWVALLNGVAVILYSARRRHYEGWTWWIASGAALIVLGLSVLVLTH
jgi:hypothetical protein